MISSNFDSFPYIGHSVFAVTQYQGVKANTGWLGIRIIYPVERRIGHKLMTPLGERLHPPSSLHSRIKIPDSHDHDAYNYLVLTMKTKRQLKSKRKIKDRLVHSVVNQIDSN